MATVKVRSVIRPNLRYVVPAHTLEVAPGAHFKKKAKDNVRQAGAPKLNANGNLEVPGPAIVQFKDGEAEVDEATWEAMQRNGVHVGLGVVGPDGAGDAGSEG